MSHAQVPLLFAEVLTAVTRSDVTEKVQPDHERRWIAVIGQPVDSALDVSRYSAHTLLTLIDE